MRLNPTRPIEALIKGKDEESCVYNDKVIELGNRAKQNGTYDSSLMDEDMERAKSTADSWCNKLYKKN